MNLAQFGLLKIIVGRPQNLVKFNINTPSKDSFLEGEFC